MPAIFFGGLSIRLDRANPNISSKLPTSTYHQRRHLRYHHQHPHQPHQQRQTTRARARVITPHASSPAQSRINACMREPHSNSLYFISEVGPNAMNRHIELPPLRSTQATDTQHSAAARRPPSPPTTNHHNHQPTTNQPPPTTTNHHQHPTHVRRSRPLFCHGAWEHSTPATPQALPASQPTP